jgi:adenylosuccinate synthase
LKEKHIKLLSFYQYEYNLNETEPTWFEGIESLKKLTVIDSEHYINNALKSGKKVLAEGAQGALLDIDFGSYPFVTSSNTTSAGVCSGLGVAPNKIGNVMGIFKAYCTRVGSGPFPTELDNEDGEKLRKIGNEFGSTTGRPRRCGWIDLPALKYAITLNGVTHLSMMKADVMNDFDTIYACTHYEIDGKQTDEMPYDLVTTNVKPIYKSFKGWKKSLGGIESYDELPSELKDFTLFLENELGVPVSIISVGPDRSETLLKSENALMV